MTTAAARKTTQDPAKIAAMAARAAARPTYLAAWGHRPGPVSVETLRKAA